MFGQARQRLGGQSRFVKELLEQLCDRFYLAQSYDTLQVGTSGVLVPRHGPRAFLQPIS
jgi:hypothetical protein